MHENELAANLDLHQVLPITETLVQEFHSLSHRGPVWIGGAERWASGGDMEGKPVTHEYTVVRSGDYIRHLAVNAMVMSVAMESADPNCRVFAPMVSMQVPNGDWLSLLSWFALDDLQRIVSIAGRPPWPNLIEVYAARRYASPSPQVLGWEISALGTLAKRGK